MFWFREKSEVKFTIFYTAYLILSDIFKVYAEVIYGTELILYSEIT